MLLPTYDVFDEVRYFIRQNRSKLSPWVTRACPDHCEDAGMTSICIAAYTALIPLTSFCTRREHGDQYFASRFTWASAKLRRQMLETIARDNKVPVLFVNQIGGNDSLILTAQHGHCAGWPHRAQAKSFA